MDMDTPEILKALEHFSQQILCQDTDFTSLEQVIERGAGENADASDHTLASMPGIMGSGENEDAGLDDLTTSESSESDFDFELSESTIKLDSLATTTTMTSATMLKNPESQTTTTPATLALPHIETDFPFMSPPVSPAMYSPPPTTFDSKPFKHSLAISQVDDFNDFIESGYTTLYEPENWNSPESIHSEELFPELTF